MAQREVTHCCRVGGVGGGVLWKQTVSKHGNPQVDVSFWCPAQAVGKRLPSKTASRLPGRALIFPSKERARARESSRPRKMGGGWAVTLCFHFRLWVTRWKYHVNVGSTLKHLQKNCWRVTQCFFPLSYGVTGWTM